ncbi:hypothetical protein Unana1_00837 [Umbelopsis nana]
MSSLALLDRQLKDINEFSQDNKALSVDIAGLVLNDITDKDLGKYFATALIFDKDNGILRYLCAAIDYNRVDTAASAAKVTLLEFLARYIERIKASAQPYVSSIKNCVIQMLEDKSVRVKTAAFEPLKALVDPANKVDTAGMGLSQLFSKFSSDFTMSSSSVKPVARYHPEAVNEAGLKSYLRWGIATLNTQLFQEKDADTGLITGSVKDPNDIESMYLCIKALIDVPEDLARYSAPLAALDFLIDHFPLFEGYLVDDCAYLYPRLLNLSNHRNRDMSKAGIYAVHKFLNVLSDKLAKSTMGPAEKKTFAFLFRTFVFSLNRQGYEQEDQSVSVAVYGIGYLAQSCMTYLKPEEFDELLQLVLKRATWMFSEANEAEDLVKDQLTPMIQTLTRFVAAMKKLHLAIETELLKATDFVFTYFTRISPYSRRLVVKAIKEMLYTIGSIGQATLRNFCHESFFPALICTVSGISSAPAPTVTTGEIRHQDWMEFRYIWEQLLQEPDMAANGDIMDVDTGNMPISTILYDELMHANSRFLNTLDLGTIEYEQSDEPGGGLTTTFQRTHTSSTGDLRALQPLKAKDFELFQNFVDFSTYFFPNIRPDLYDRWPDSATERERVLYREYLIDVLARMEQYQDDLLVSGLHLILSAPLELLDVHYFVGPLQTALEIGLTQIGIASAAIDTLSSILEQAQLQDDDRKRTAYIKELTQVVPFLSKYLATDLQLDAEVDFSAGAGSRQRPKKVKLKAEGRRHKISAGLLGVLEDDPESAADLQIRAVRFLGRLGGYNKSILDPKIHIKDMKSYDIHQGEQKAKRSKHQDEVLAWDSDRHVKVKLPFTGARVDLPLDEILPRVCSLAEHSLDRSTKVAACELLQATLMIMIGNSAFQARGGKEPVKSPYHRLYLKIFPILLRLAVNTDQTIRDIIRPLLSQMIHWLTNNAQYENPETIALLNTCIDGVCDVNGTLQDYSAQCLHEFVKWSIKQTDVKRQEENPINMKSLLKRVYALASNPKPAKRLGAALTFNRIYRMFREEESLVDQFTLEILYWMLFSLKLAHDDHESVGTQEQAIHAISHIQRILHKKHALFDQPRPRRRPTPTLEKADLPSFIEFAFTQISERQIKYSKKNLEIFTECVPYTSKSAVLWLTERLKSDPDYVIQILEEVRLRDIKGLDSIGCDALLGCYENMTGALTSYSWLLEGKVATVGQLIGHPKSKLLSVFQDLASKCGPSIVQTLQDTTTTTLASRRNQGRILRNFVSAAIYFVLVLTENGMPPFQNNVLSSPEFKLAFGQFLYGHIFQSSIFQKKDEIEDILNRPKAKVSKLGSNIAAELLRVLKEKDCKESVEACLNSLASVLFAREGTLENMVVDNDTTIDGVDDILHGMLVLQDHDLMDSLVKEGSTIDPSLCTPYRIINHLYSLFKSISSTRSPDQRLIASNLLSVCLTSSQSPSLVNDLIDSMKHNRSLYIDYAQPINQFVSKHFEHVSDSFVNHLEEPHVQALIHGVLSHHVQNSVPKSQTQGLLRKVGEPLDVLREIILKVFVHNGNIRSPIKFINKRTLLEGILRTWTSDAHRIELARLLKVLSSLQEFMPSDLNTPSHLVLLFNCLDYFLQPNVPLSVKNEALPALSFFLPFESFSTQIEPKLKAMTSNQFPRLSSDIDKGSVLYVEYIECLDHLIHAMVDAKSRMIFQLLLTVIFQDEKHSHSKALHDGIAKYCSKLDTSEFNATSSVCFQFFQDISKDLRFRKNAIQAILGPMLMLVPQGHVISFYQANITTIMSTLKSEIRSNPSDEISLGSIEEKKLVHTTKSLISTTWEESQGAAGEGRQMTIDLIRFGHKIRSQLAIRSFPENLHKSILQCQRYAYNAIVAAIVCTQKSEKFFIGFCFKEKPEERIWSNLLDTSDPVELPIEFKRPPIRAKLGELKSKAWIGAERKQSVRYLSSQYLLGSSLSQPATQAVEEVEASDKPSEYHADTATLAVSNEEYDVKLLALSSLELELDFFNKHPCMTSILRMIIKLHIDITPPSPSPGSDKLPLWMSELLKSFVSPLNGLHVRLFISKIVVNWPTAFEKYANSWIQPLMKLVMEGDSYGEPMNYHVQDLCFIIISWIPSITFETNRENKMLMFSFVSYLMRHAHHEHRNVLRTNLEIVKLIFEQWKDFIVVPTKIIYDKIGNVERTSKEKMTGLQLCGITLAHDMLPTIRSPETVNTEPSDSEFYNSIIQRVDSKETELFSIAAEVAGWMLSVMRKQNCLNTEFEQALIAKLTRISQVNESKLLICLYKLQINDSIICEPFSNKVLDILPRQTGKLRGYALMVLACNAQKIDQLFESLQFKNVWKTLQQRDELSQLAMLQILEKIAASIDPSRIDSILSLLVQAFVTNPSAQCREIYYRILKELYKVVPRDHDVFNRLKIALLRGLMDPSESVRNDVALFWKSQHSNSDIFNTVRFQLSEMYDPEVEEVYLQYSNWMILDATKSSFDYNKPMFEQPLPNAKFDDQFAQISTSWRANSSMTPLFVASMDYQNAYSLDEGSPVLRATQEFLEFTPTQVNDVPGSKSSLSMSSQSSMLFDYAGTGPSAIMDTVMSESQRDVDELRSTAYSKRDSSGRVRGRRRFTEQKPHGASKFFRNREAYVKRSVLQYQTYQAEAQKHKVSLYRRYRVGDLPDIQILHQDLILPLQSLGQKDIEIARTLYRILVVSIADASEGRPSTMGEETTGLKQQILQLLHQVLQKTTLNYPPAIGSFLRIFYEMEGLELSPALIMSVAQASFNEQTGISLLEKQLQVQSSPERDHKRSKLDKKSSLQPFSKDQWIQLATLYNSINEHEIFSSLYSEKIASKDMAIVAIDAESEGDYLLASNLLLNLIEESNEEVGYTESNIWEQERLRCLEKMALWDDLALNVMVEVEDDVELLWDSATQRLYFDFFMKSFSKLPDGIEKQDQDFNPWTETNTNPLEVFVNKAMSYENRIQYLVSNYSPELAALHFQKSDMDRARYYVRQSYRHFISSLSRLHPLASNSRYLKLQGIQKIVEMDDFLNSLNDPAASGIPSISSQITMMQHRYPSPEADTMDVWDEVMINRLSLLDALSLVKGTSMEKLNIQAKELQKKMHIKMADVASGQFNFVVATNALRKAKKFQLDESDHLNLALKISIGKLSAIQDNAKKVDLLDRMLNNVCSSMGMMAAAPEKEMNFNLIASQVFESAILFMRDETAGSPLLQRSKRSVWLHKLNLQNQTDDAVLQGLCDRAYGYVEKAIDIVSHLILFDHLTYAYSVIDGVFKAMNLGVSDAAHLFPRLLQIIEEYPATRDHFKTCSKELNGIWLLLPWLPQLVAVMDKSIASAVNPLVQAIAKSYPKALYYPVAISKEHYHFDDNEQGRRQSKQVQIIWNYISSPLMDDFVTELRRLTNPEHIVKDFIDYAMSIMENPSRDPNKILAAFNELNQLLLDLRSNRLGPIPKAFALKHASQLYSFCGRDGSKLTQMTSKDFRKLIKYYQKDIQNQKLPGAPELLKSYSPWLSNFHHANFAEEIEIPGQYSGNYKPDPAQHAKISNFDERVLVMSSLRKPKRIRMYGTDEKEYMFLVKGGEDLRLDQRIQQLFTVMNSVISGNTFCSRQGIYLITYKVIPMTGSIGVIEWLDDTKPIRACIEEKPVRKNQMVRLQEAYRSWVANFKGDTMGYRNLMQAPRDTVVKQFDMLTSTIPSTVLRDSIYSLAASPEAFLSIRQDFAYSLAAISVCGYILGIGDRHLENFLIDKKSGRLISIDFGHAFGSATELLPVPEVIPFRLTKQFVGFLDPLGVAGILRVPMINILEALRNSQDLLLNVMDIFVKEPLMDWKKIAIKRGKEQKEREGSTTITETGSAEGSADFNQIAWYPQQKIEIASKKLRGENPGYIVAQELMIGHGSKPYISAMKKVALGDKQYNFRAKVPQMCPTVSDQVNCLLDLATDNNVLGRMWVGWMSFI